MGKRLAVLLVLGGCFGTDDVTGPFTGTSRRYVVDGFELPTSYTTAQDMGADLDGDGTIDNVLGSAIGTLGQYNDITTHGADMFAAGAIASSVVIRADDTSSDDSVAVTYYGSDGDPATLLGGRLEGGVFESNRTATTHVPGDAIVRLPLFADVDPSDVPVFAMQMTLEPDGGDGFNASIQGAVGSDFVTEESVARIVQLVAAAPDRHRLMLEIFDRNYDWVITHDEIADNGLFRGLVSPDVTLFGQHALSFGFRAHLSPCESGTCTTALPEDPCFDRVRDGEETDVDCGGSCGPCRASERCATANDCDSGACDAGQCRAPTCSDGHLDGFETDVDCGGNCGSTCALNARCFLDSDCASKLCAGHSVDTYTFGTCAPPAP